MAVLIISGKDFADTVCYWLANPTKAPDEFHTLMAEINETVAKQTMDAYMAVKSAMDQPTNRKDRRKRAAVSKAMLN